ncbi:putative toxin-antitoxin system toxin component, PIN family [Rhizobium terrae]|uniref:putative toxin-antitoxin system toxin component, PIN family n=1 Tax=Rhizobium terrae TaxID=2171756 RepID=UPI0021F8E07C|nr:putative toxin-antitoxin system toxin component, PIN family [Rhizobium terrae]
MLDTNVLAAAFRSRNGASFIILQKVAARQIKLLVTTALLLEYEAVLKRPEQIAAHGLPLSRIDDAIREFAALSEPIDLHYQWRPQLSDPKDELVMEAAINGRADALVTYNVRDFQHAAGRFGIRLLRPSEFLEQLKP